MEEKMMADIKPGDIIRGKPESDEYYSTTNSKMTRAIVKSVEGSVITVIIQEHSEYALGKYKVLAEYIEIIGHLKPFNRDEVLELFKSGCKKALLDYDLTGADLTDADLTRADLRDADLTGADLTRADLRGADLTGADLTRADVDFSCWPLWCGSLNVTTDKRIACQLAYHLCSLQCDDAEYITMRNSILGFANQSHVLTRHGQPKLTPLNVPDGVPV